MEGTILFYKKEKRYGFITEDNKVEGENEIFFHASGISANKFIPQKGQRVTYDVVESDKKIQDKLVMNAVNVKPMERF